MRVVTSRAALREAAAHAPTGARVPVELRVRVADPFEAYRRARHGDGNDIYLETTGGQSGWGYFATDAIERVQVSAGATSLDEHASIDAAYEWGIGHARELVARAVAGDRSVGRAATFALEAVER